MPRVLALDVATRMGVADGEVGSTPVLTTVKLGRELDDHGDLFARALRWMINRLDPAAPHAPHVIVLEAPFQAHDARVLFGLRGVMLGTARYFGHQVIEVTPATWRTLFIGPGASKLKGPQAKALAVERCADLGWGRDLNHNAAEAAGIWLYGCTQVAPKLAHRAEPLFLRRAQCR